MVCRNLYSFFFTCFCYFISFFLFLLLLLLFLFIIIQTTVQLSIYYTSWHVCLLWCFCLYIYIYKHVLIYTHVLGLCSMYTSEKINIVPFCSVYNQYLNLVGMLLIIEGPFQWLIVEYYLNTQWRKSGV